FANVTRDRARLLDELSSAATCQTLLAHVRSHELQQAAIAELEVNFDSNVQVAAAGKKPKAPAPAAPPPQAVAPPQTSPGFLAPAPPQAPSTTAGPTPHPASQPAWNPQMNPRRNPDYGYGGRIQTRNQVNNDSKLSTYPDNVYSFAQNTM